MLNRLKGMGRTILNLWSFRLGVHEAEHFTSENNIVYENYGSMPDNSEGACHKRLDRTAKGMLQVQVLLQLCLILATSSYHSSIR
jgi:hypothetical protein